MEKRYDGKATVKAVQAAVEQRMPWMLTRLEELVKIESPSGDKRAVDRAVDIVAAWCAELDGEVKRHSAEGSTAICWKYGSDQKVQSKSR